MFVLLASNSDFKSKLECWQGNGPSVSKLDATSMIQRMFEICVDMLKCFHKIQYVDVDLLTDEDHKQLKEIAKEKAAEIIVEIFGKKSVVSLN